MSVGARAGSHASEGSSMPPWRGLLGLLLILTPWPAGPVLLLSCMLTIGRPFGVIGIVGSLVLMTAAIKAPTPPVRYALCALTTAVAAAAPAGHRAVTLFCAFFVTFMIHLCCVQQKPWPAVRELLLDEEKLCPKTYFPQCEVFGDFSKVQSEKSFFAFHPHGIFSAGWTLTACFNRTFLKGVQKVTFLIDTTLRYKNPFFKVVLEWCTTKEIAWDAADKKPMLKLMAAGANVALIPGGFQDATLFTFGKDRIVLKNRKGFIKYCLQYSYRLHPVYTFGESDTYYALGGFEKLRLWLNGQGVPTVMPFGWPICPLLPRPQAKLLTFVGPALELPKIEEPTEKDVNEWHGKYMAALQKLFDEKKMEAGRPHATLEIL